MYVRFIQYHAQLQSLRNTAPRPRSHAYLHALACVFVTAFEHSHNIVSSPTKGTEARASSWSLLVAK